MRTMRVAFDVSEMMNYILTLKTPISEQHIQDIVNSIVLEQLPVVGNTMKIKIRPGDTTTK